MEGEEEWAWGREDDTDEKTHFRTAFTPPTRAQLVTFGVSFNPFSFRQSFRAARNSVVCSHQVSDCELQKLLKEFQSCWH